MQYCSLAHRILLSPPDTFTTGGMFPHSQQESEMQYLGAISKMTE